MSAEMASASSDGRESGLEQQQQHSYHPASGSLAKQNEYLKQVVARLQHELKLYQQGQAPTQIHGPGSSSPDSSYPSPEELPPWTFDSNVMTPLLLAYDSRIHQLETANHRNESNVDRLQSYLNELSQENERLHTELNEANQRLLQQPLGHDGTASGTINPPISTPADGQTEEYQQRYELAMKESHYLRQEVNALAEESDNLRNALHERQSLIDTYRQKTIELGEGMKSAQGKLNEERQHNTYYERKAAELQTEVDTLQWKRQSMETEVTQLENEKQQLQESLYKYKTALEDLSRQSESDSSNLMERLKTVNNRTKELQRKLSERDEQMDALNARFKEVDLELNNARRDCEGMLRVIRSLEKQLNEYKSKEDTLTRREREVAEKMEEAETQKQSALSKAEADRDEVGRLCDRLESHKSEALNQEKDAVATVRERLNSQLSDKQVEIDRLEQKVGEVRAERDRALRDTASYKSDLSRVKQAHEESKRTHKSDFASSQRQSQDEISKQNNELQRVYKSLKGVQDELSEQKAISQESGKRKEHLESEVHSLKEELANVQNKMAKLRSEKEAARNQLHEQEATAQQREHNLRLELERTVQSFQAKVSTLQRQHDEYVNALRNSEEQRERITGQLNSALAKQSSQSQITVSKIKKQARFAFDESNHLQEEVKNLQEQLDDVREQYAKLYKSYIESEERANSLETALESATDEHTARAKEVAALISREEEHIREIEQLKRQLQNMRPTTMVESPLSQITNQGKYNGKNKDDVKRDYWQLSSGDTGFRSRADASVAAV
eukprot:gb/GECG01005950.1/.p1 GENE.gb/GECG01005950.1/~~gb/GECG01005950.1/.p1  ORF type:complete len:791 (+),score=162.27 gb/GECG01005950.1/:1-2373(+)